MRCTDICHMCVAGRSTPSSSLPLTPATGRGGKQQQPESFLSHFQAHNHNTYTTGIAMSAAAATTYWRIAGLTYLQVSCVGLLGFLRLSPPLPPSLPNSFVSSQLHYDDLSAHTTSPTPTHFLTNSTRARRRVCCVRHSRYVQQASDSRR